MVLPCPEVASLCILVAWGSGHTILGQSCGFPSEKGVAEPDGLQFLGEAAGGETHRVSVYHWTQVYNLRVAEHSKTRP